MCGELNSLNNAFKYRALHLDFRSIHQPIVIIGAGAAGLACAISAAKQRHPVVLLEQQADIGGTVVNALIHTLGGLFDEQGEQLNAGLPEEPVERLMQASTFTQQRRIGKTMTLNVDPAVYLQVIHDWLAEFSNIDIYCQAEVTDYFVQNRQVGQITITQAGRVFTLKPWILVDTTGHVVLVRQFVQDGEVLAGIILQLRGVAANALKFPKRAAVLRKVLQAVAEGSLPSECATLWLDTGVYPDEDYAKFNTLRTGTSS